MCPLTQLIEIYCGTSWGKIVYMEECGKHCGESIVQSAYIIYVISAENHNVGLEVCFKRHLIFINMQLLQKCH